MTELQQAPEAAGGIVAVVPAHNEAPRVGGVVRGAGRFLPVLVVDDGSTDETAAVAEEAGATVLRLSPNGGKGAALRAGFAAALQAGHGAALTLDGDGQHDPDEIPAFLAAYERTEADLIIGYRDFRRMPPQRRLSNTLARWMFSWAVGRTIVDNQSGYRLMSRRLMEVVGGSGERGFAFEVEVIARCIAMGYALEWVPIKTIYAGQTSHIRVWTHITSFVDTALRARRIVKAGPAPSTAR